LLQTAVVGVFTSMDLFLFYLFFEVSLVPMYFLIGIWGGPERRHAATSSKPPLRSPRRLLRQDKHRNRQQTQRREQNVMAPTGNQSNHVQSPMTFQMAQTGALLQLRCTIMGAMPHITSAPLTG